VDLLCQLLEQFPATMGDAGVDAIEAIRCRVTLPQAPPALRAAVRAIVAHCPDPLGRYKAVRALGAFAGDAARESIRQYLDSEDKMVRLAAVESIGHWATPEAKDLLTRRQSVEADADVLAALQDAIQQPMRDAA
jgi:HEAT repeat protein